ncbi:hypothetical protein [Rhodovulum sp. ES.010]|uniref:hypothetical protein n=1 Tax=Rhodovulum sp. ES.010 TaxID=1882821 RepID=UPI0015880E0D|nr:hypothetical protein [Rhodovulum sp. ES.010]
MLAEYRSAIVAPSAIAADDTVTALTVTGAYRVAQLAVRSIAATDYPTKTPGYVLA